MPWHHFGTKNTTFDGLSSGDLWSQIVTNILEQPFTINKGHISFLKSTENLSNKPLSFCPFIVPQQYVEY